MLNQPTKIILDTDIGDDIDDAFALALILQSQKELELLGVTTVFRNAEKRAKVAKAIISLYHQDIKVYPGVDQPIIQVVDQLLSDEIKAKEKKDENGKYHLPQYQEELMDHQPIEQEHAIDFIIRSVHQYENEVVLVAIGPLTNLAMAIRKDPSIVQKVKKIVIMGGYDENKYPEWNIFCDPEAARIVYTSGAEIDAVGLDVTLQCGLTKDDIALLKSSSKSAPSLISTMLEQWFEHYRFATPIMHDPLAVATLIDHFVTFEKKIVEVQLVSPRGATIAVNQLTPTSSFVNVARTVNKDRFLKMFKERVF